MKRVILRAVVEIGFIIFLFYANLLMGVYSRSGPGRERGLVWAIEDICTPASFAIALAAALVGYLIFESLRTKL